MSPVALPELPPDYYLKNFEQLCSQVQLRYGDLLSINELQWLESFEKLSPDGRKLYVRLLTRAKPCVLLAKIHYAEISNINVALEKLEEAKLATVNHETITSAQWLTRLTIAQLKQLASSLKVDLRRGSNKADLLSELEEFADQTTMRRQLSALYPQTSVLGLEHMESFRLLFFGNLYQDLSEFIISDLGHLRYENYPLDKTSRAFSQRSHIDQMLAYARLGEQIDQHIADASTADLQLWFDQLAANHDHPRLQRRYDKLANKLARQMERLAQPVLALEMYRQSQLPPSRERQCRLLTKLDRPAEAMTLLEQISTQPITEPEAEFAEMVDLVGSHKIVVDEMISRVEPMANIQAIFESLRTAKTDVKVLLQPAS
jgi:hypothetical protein